MVKLSLSQENPIIAHVVLCKKMFLVNSSVNLMRKKHFL